MTRFKRGLVVHTTTLLPAGKYYVGDLCYVLGEPDAWWQDFVAWMFENDSSGRKKEGPAEYKGKVLSYHGTAYGDGSFEDQEGRTYGVDAGMIGCVRAEDIPVNALETLNPEGSHFIQFSAPFDTSYKDGVITIGHIVIDTN